MIPPVTTANSGIPVASRKRGEPANVKQETAKDAPSMTKSEAVYTDAWNDEKTQCHACTMFRQPHGCTLVQGHIASIGHCENFEMKSPRSPDYASDSLPIRLGMDRASVREFDVDGRMRVSKAHISKANICPYRGEEIPNYEELGLDPDQVYNLLRHPDELKKAAPTFNGIQVLRKHVPVNAEDHRAWDVVGTTGTDANWSDPYLDNSIHIWAKDAIRDIENDEKKELSCGYHYSAEMTPGKFLGKSYDGVMRDIVGNHVALVEKGRAGPDVVVGDSMENLMAKKLPTRLAKMAFDSTLTSLPALKKGAKVDLLPIFSGITRKNYSAKQILIALDKALKGKLAKDANMKDVAEVLHHLESVKEPKSLDESVSGPQHRAMEAAAHGHSNLGISKKVGEEFEQKDKGKHFADEMPEHLKGFDEEQMAQARDWFSKSALDERDDEADKAKVDAERDEPEGKDEEEDIDAGEKPGFGEKSEGEKEDREGEEHEEKDKYEDDHAGDDTKDLDEIEHPGTKEPVEDEDEGAEDMSHDQAMVTKVAMDAAIRAATESTAKAVRESVRKEQREIRMALDEVKPIVGELRADAEYNSANDVYKLALDSLPKFDKKLLKGMHPSAYRAVLLSQPKAGAHEISSGDAPAMGMDEASSKKLNEMFPMLDRIGFA